MAVCAVMGHGLDLVDVDPRNGGDLASVPVPTVYGLATTPSAGVHAFVKSLNVRSRNNLVPGVDVKAGDKDGKGRGFAFLAPTIRTSKVTGRPTPYVWMQVPGPVHGWLMSEDTTGEALADLVRRAHGQVPVIPAADVHGLEIAPSVDQFLTVGPWVDVERTLRSGRNDGVMRLAAALRGEGGWPVERALDYMKAVVWPVIDQSQAGHEFSLDEFEHIVRGVWERYPDGKVSRLDEAVDTGAERPPALAGVGLLDAWFVDRVAVSRLAGRYLWARGLGWLEWDSRRWVAVDGSVVVDDVRQYIQWLHGSAAAAGADSDLLKRIAGLGAKSRLGGLVELCRGVSGVRADVSEFDAYPDLLNCGNGIVDLRSGALHAHDPELRLTKITDVGYVPGAESADWKAALEAVPEDVRDWWQLRIGQAATGHMTPDDLLIVQVGGGENGKTTLMSAIRGALGEYYLLVSHRALLGNSDSVPTELMDFRGARLALLEETPEERRLAVTKLKALVGTPEITARRMRQDPVTFPASHSLFISTNYLPVVSETDHGTWRRLACLKFPFRWLKPSQQPESDMDRPGDPGLRARLVEGSGGQHEAVLAWVVEGAVRWYAEHKVMPGLPDRVESSTWDWRANSDLILSYVSERLEFDPTAHVMARELADDLNEWLVSRGHRAWSAELVASRFGEHSEVAAHHVEKVKKRVDDGLSRRPARSGMVTEGVPSGPYYAWLGVKFADGGSAEKQRVLGVPPPNGFTDVSDTQKTESAVSKGHVDLPTCGVPGVPTITVPLEFQESTISVGIGIGRNTWNKDQLEDQLTESPKVTKAEQKRLDKRRAVVDAAGPITPLPVLVDRAGTVTPISPDTILWRLSERSALTVDVETTGYPIGHPDYALRTIQLGDAEGAVVLDATDPDHRDLARTILAGARVLHAHSATADLAPLAVAGLVDYDEAWSRMQDTVIPAKLADPMSTGSDPALKQLSDVVLGADAVSPTANEARAELFRLSGWLTDTKSDTPVERSGWAQVDPACRTMQVYAASDVLDTAELPDRVPAPPAEVWERERLAQRMTARVAYRGLALDGARVAELRQVHEQAQATAAREICAHGIRNPGSDTQVGTRLVEMGAELPRTATGKPSVAKDAIVGLQGDQGAIGELVRARLEFSHHEKLLSSFLKPYSTLVTSGDGRVRPTVYTLGADTGRMSCVRPNLQQVPRTGGVRACITADPGHLLISADFASVEVRVMAALSQDPNLMYQLANGLNIHEQIAAQVFGPDWTKENKYTVKRGVFGWAYGGGIATLAAQVGVSESIMASVIDVLSELAPRYVAWSRELKRAVQGGMTQFQTYSGRVIHLDARLPHKAPNYLVQGTARELLIDALIRWSVTQWGECTLLPVHDELVAMVPEADAPAALTTLVSSMESQLYGVAIRAEASEPSFAWHDST